MGLNPLIFHGAGEVNNAKDTFQDMLLSVENGNKMRQTFRSLPLQDQMTDLNNKNAIQEARLKSVGMASQELLPYLDNDQALISKLFDRREMLIAQGLPTMDTDEVIQAFKQNPQMAKNMIAGAAQMYQQMGGNRNSIPAPLQEHQYHMGILNDPNASPDQKKASRIALKLDPAPTTSDSRTADAKNWEQYQAMPEGEAKKQFGRASGFLPPVPKMSGKSEDTLTKAQDKYFELDQMASKAESIAQSYEELEPSAGVAASLDEAFKRFLGNEDDVSLLRTNYIGLRNSVAVKNLPPGVASDKDIALALEGYPKDTTNPRIVASFMRGYAKLLRVERDFNEFRSDYISRNGNSVGFLKAWKERSKNPDTYKDIVIEHDPLGIL